MQGFSTRPESNRRDDRAARAPAVVTSRLSSSVSAQASGSAGDDCDERSASSRSTVRASNVPVTPNSVSPQTAHADADAAVRERMSDARGGGGGGGGSDGRRPASTAAAVRPPRTPGERMQDLLDEISRLEQRWRGHEQQQREHEQQLEQQRRKHEQQLEQQRREHEQQLEQQRREHEQQLEQQRREHEQQLEQQRREHEQQRREHEQQQREQEEKRDTQRRLWEEGIRLHTMITNLELEYAALADEADRALASLELQNRKKELDGIVDSIFLTTSYPAPPDENSESSLSSGGVSATAVTDEATSDRSPRFVGSSLVSSGSVDSLPRSTGVSSGMVPLTIDARDATTLRVNLRLAGSSRFRALAAATSGTDAAAATSGTDAAAAASGEIDAAHHAAKQAAAGASATAAASVVDPAEAAAVAPPAGAGAAQDQRAGSVTAAVTGADPATVQPAGAGAAQDQPTGAGAELAADQRAAAAGAGAPGQPAASAPNQPGGTDRSAQGAGGAGTTRIEPSSAHCCCTL
jgi:hypothetical protein